MKLEHINVKEAVRYMGMGNNKPDERTALLIDECEKELLKVIEPKFVYRVFDIAHKENGVESSALRCSLVVMIYADTLRGAVNACFLQQLFLRALIESFVLMRQRIWLKL